MQTTSKPVECAMIRLLLASWWFSANIALLIKNTKFFEIKNREKKRCRFCCCWTQSSSVNNERINEKRVMKNAKWSENICFIDMTNRISLTHKISSARLADVRVCVLSLWQIFKLKRTRFYYPKESWFGRQSSSTGEKGWRRLVRRETKHEMSIKLCKYETKMFWENDEASSQHSRAET